MTPGRPSLTLQVASTIDAIRPATEQAEAWLAEHRVSFEAMYLASLAIEELVTNCIKYGYDDSNDHSIEIVFVVEDGALRMEVIDDGHPFNPLQAPSPDLSVPIEHRPIGGLGIHLLRELADDVSYERRDGTNRLRLTKRMA
jgi:anti-sigma regulatory factor (Ser/Thr protein kinase)